MDSLIFYNLPKGGSGQEKTASEDEIYMHAGIPLFAHQNTNHKIGGGNDSYVVPVGIYSQQKRNKRQVTPIDENEPDVPVINPAFFDKLFGKVGHEIHENGHSKTRKVHP